MNGKVLINSPKKFEAISPLDHLGWLSEQPETFKSWAAEVGLWRNYQAGRFVYRAGDTSDGVYGLTAGSVEVGFPLIAGETISFHRAEIGYWIGEAAELAQVPRLISLRAATDCRLLQLPSNAIQKFLSDHPEYWHVFCRLSAINTATIIGLLSEALSLTVRARVSRRLLQLAEVSSEAIIAQDELAKLLGVTRVTLRRCLDDLEAQGAIEKSYRKVVILNRDLLIALRNER